MENLSLEKLSLSDPESLPGLSLRHPDEPSAPRKRTLSLQRPDTLAPGAPRPSTKIHDLPSPAETRAMRRGGSLKPKKKSSKKCKTCKSKKIQKKGTRKQRRTKYNKSSKK